MDVAVITARAPGTPGVEEPCSPGRGGRGRLASLEWAGLAEGQAASGWPGQLSVP